MQTRTKKESQSVLEWFTVGWGVQAGLIFYFPIMETKEMEGPLTHKKGGRKKLICRENQRVPGWRSWVSVQLLILAEVVMPGL